MTVLCDNEKANITNSAGGKRYGKCNLGDFSESEKNYPKETVFLNA